LNRAPKGRRITREGVGRDSRSHRAKRLSPCHRRKETNVDATGIDFEREFTSGDYKHLPKYGELAPSVVERLANCASRNQFIIDHYRQSRDPYGKTIVFAAVVPLSRTLAEAGVSVDYVYCSHEDSQTVMDAHREKPDRQVLANVGILTRVLAPRRCAVRLAPSHENRGDQKKSKEG